MVFKNNNSQASTDKAGQGDRHVFFQPKLTINQPNDVYEHEADDTADRVTRMPDPIINDHAFFKPAQANVQRKCQHCEEEEKLRRKENSAAKTEGSHDLDSYVASLGSSGQSLSDSSRQFFEPRFGHDFSNVHIHTDSVAAKSAQSINALAYTTGNNIVFNSGQYSPDSDSGKRLMAHELTHVIQQGGALQTASIQRDLKDPLDVMEGYTEDTIASMVLDSQSLHARLTTIGGREYDGFVRSISKDLITGNYQAERVYGPDALRTWNIFKPDNSKLFGGMMFEVEIPSVDFNNLGFKKRVPLSVVSGQLSSLKNAIPVNADYNEVKSDLAYIDNFKSASYDVFRREVHLIYEDGNEVAIPINQIDRNNQPLVISDSLKKKLDELEKSGDLQLPSSTQKGDGKYTSIDTRPADKFYEDTTQHIIKPQNIRASVAPRLIAAINALDVDTQDNLFKAATAFMAGPPLPDGFEYVILLPVGAKMASGLKSALAKSAESKLATDIAEKEAPGAAKSELQKNAEKELKEAMPANIKTPYASSVGELAEAGVIKDYAPAAKQLPPKFKAFDWYEGGKETTTNIPSKYKNKPITVQETSVEGGTWTSLHTVLSADKATTQNVGNAVTNKLNAIFDALHNPTGNAAARDPNPIAPDTYRRVERTGTPDKVIVHIHLAEAPVTTELNAAAQKAKTDFASLSDLPPVEVVVTGTNKTSP